VGDGQLAAQLDRLAQQWRKAFDPETGLLVDSAYYEGGKWNYSFRLLPDMDSRIQLAGGDDQFMEKLDAFFGYGAEPVQQVGERPSVEELADGFALDRFEGLNNEPDMEAPWCYHYLGRPDRTAEVVHAALNNQFGLGRGGLPGNDDSGGLSSWYVWASLGLFPVAGQSLYLLNAPSVSSARLVFGTKELALETSGFVEPEPGGPVQYVQSVTFNGEPLDRTWLSASDMYSGGELHFKLGHDASGWGRSSRPPSISAREEPG
jgi:putative alpha-1,2-mannosidase